MNIAAIGTYLPPWGSAAARIAGDDEDVVTMAVQAGRAALSGAGAGVRPRGARDARAAAARGRQRRRARRRLGPSRPDDRGRTGRWGTGGARRAASRQSRGPWWSAPTRARGVVPRRRWSPERDGVALDPVARVLRSLPVRARGADGVVHDYEDPRLVRERGMRPALADAGIGRKAAAAVGLPAKRCCRALRRRRAPRAHHRRECPGVRARGAGRDAHHRVCSSRSNRRR